MRRLLQLCFSPRGRINRALYWFASLALLAGFAALVLGFASIVDPTTREDRSTETLAIKAILIAAYAVIAYANIVLGIKRYHDRDKSGWWLLLAVIPLIGSFVVGIELGFLRGTSGPNRFGADRLTPRRGGLARPDMPPVAT